MSLNNPCDEPASLTILGLHGNETAFSVRLLTPPVAEAREIVLAAEPLRLRQGSMVKLACSSGVILGRVAAVHTKEDVDEVTLEVRHRLNEADLRVIHDKWF
jgi:hypothetical protein